MAQMTIGAVRGGNFLSTKSFYKLGWLGGWSRFTKSI